MRKFLCVAVVLPLAAQVITTSRIAGGLNAIRASAVEADVRFLASDELQGRLSLQPGSDAAIKWIAAEFKKAGVKPAGLNDSYLQPVPLIEYRTDREASGLTIHYGAKSQTFHAPEASGIFPKDIDITAPVIFAGFGITAPELHYDDYAGIDARGKIVLIFDHEPRERDPKSIFNGKGNTLYAGSYMKTLTAQKHGAAAVLVMPEPNRSHPSNQERLARIRGANLRARIPSQAIENGELKIPLVSIGDQAAAELLGTEGKRLQEAIDTTLKPQSRELPGVTAAIKIAHSESRRATSYNVLGLVEGSDPRLSRETIVISAHYDHDGPAPNGIYHGADDNASGTAGVVELARAFMKNAIKPRRSLLFAVFAAEERGLLGSYYYVSHPLRPLDLTRAVVNFDMIGRNETASEQTKGLIDIAPDTSNELNLVGANYSPDYKNLVERANYRVELNLNYKWDEEPALNVFFRSDHYPFAMHGIPALWWFTGFHPDYHQTTDTPEKINYEKMIKILKLAFIAAFDLGDAASPPKFKP